jgi:fatty acid desaturase
MRRSLSPADAVSPFADGRAKQRRRARRWPRYLIWLALVVAVFAAYAWLPWPATWIETALALALIACLFVSDEMSRF